MAYTNTDDRTDVTDEERRDFLKSLGVVGTVAAGGVTLDEVRDQMAAGSAEELAPVGQAIQSDLAGELDANLLASQQAAVAEAAQEVPAVVERGLPEGEPRSEFATVEEAARPAYEHMADVGFFGSTTEHLPAFTPEYLTEAIQLFAASEALAEPLAEMDLTNGEGVDLLASIVTNAEQLSKHHWAATDEMPREEMAIGEYIPPMTQLAAGGVLLWLGDIDQHLWQNKVLITEDTLATGVWNAHAMTAGFYLMTEGAKVIAADEGALSESDLAALLSTGFAVQALGQNFLTQNLYWITEEQRADKSMDYEVITKEL
jgi:hypothetical protein